MDMLIWGIVCIVTAIAEVVTLQLVSVWFSVGALAAFLAAVFGAGRTVQFIVFVVVSALLLACTRPIIKKVMCKKIVPTNADREIGSTATIIETVDGARGTGRARKDGVDWIAVAANGQIIPEGTVVRITDIRGAKLFVEPEAAPQPAASAAKQ